MRITSRETILAGMTALAGLGALTYILCEPRVKEFRNNLKEQKRLQEKIRRTDEMVAQEKDWERKLGEVSRGLNEFLADRDMTADMLITLENLAGKSSLRLTKRDAEKEKKQGYVYELAIKCGWEASLEALVQFLFQLQEQGAMMDLAELSVKPEKGSLKGNFTVSCAYRKKGKEAGTRPKPHAGAPPTR